MLKSSLALFLFSLLSVFCVSVGHTVVKRKAPNGQLYVFAKLDKCVSVESEEPCPVSWPLNDFYSKLYKQHNNVVKTLVDVYRTVGIPEQCTEAVRKILCSQATPRCSSKGVDFGDALTTCRNLDDSCSAQFASQLQKGGFCDKLLTGDVAITQCVTVTTPVKGVCPQPRFKMPSQVLEKYRENSESLSETFKQLENLKYDNGERVYSSECLSQLEEIGCSPLYCSADEKVLLVKHDQEDCHKTVKECFDDVLSKLSLVPSLRKLVDSMKTTLKSNCDTYPKASTAQLLPEPPTIPVPTAGTTSTTKCMQFPYLLSAVVFLVKIYFEDM